jgi:hypothetical protein
MKFETELVGQTIQGSEEYLDFDLETGERYPVRATERNNSIEVFVGKSFTEWEDDYISRKRLTSGWQNSFYIEDDIPLDELRESYDDVFEMYEDQLADAIDLESGSNALKQVRTALD